VSTGAAVGSALALPTVEAAPNHAFGLTGGPAAGSTSEGELSLSVDGNYVVVAGYNRMVGVTGNVTSTTAMAVNRMVARIDGASVINTSTLFGNSAFSGNNVRGVTTIDGTSFWGSGAGGANAGIWLIQLGPTPPAAVQVFATATRWVSIFGNELYGTGSNSPFQNVFKVGSGSVPVTAGQTAMTLNGMPAAGFSPHGFVLLNRAGVDTLYMADDGTGATPATDRGIQKWTLSGTTWSRQVTFVDPAAVPVGFRGLLAVATGSDTTLIAVTTETSANRIVKFVDLAGSTTASAGTAIATALANQVYRGVALAPHR
jgi:hypothetical protein